MDGPALSSAAWARAWFVLIRIDRECHGLVLEDVVQVHSGFLRPWTTSREAVMRLGQHWIEISSIDGILSYWDAPNYRVAQYYGCWASAWLERMDPWTASVVWLGSKSVQNRLCEGPIYSGNPQWHAKSRIQQYTHLRYDIQWFVDVASILNVPAGSYYVVSFQAVAHLQPCIVTFT